MMIMKESLMFYVTLAGECERENVEHDKTAKDVDEPWRQPHSSAVAVVGGGRGKVIIS